MVRDAAIALRKRHRNANGRIGDPVSPAIFNGAPANENSRAPGRWPVT